MILRFFRVYDRHEEEQMVILVNIFHYLNTYSQYVAGTYIGLIVMKFPICRTRYSAYGHMSLPVRYLQGAVLKPSDGQSHETNQVLEW